MTYAVNAAVHRIEAPPIMEAQTWVRPGLRNRPLLNLCQAVPGWSPSPDLEAEVGRVAKEPGTSLYTDIFGLPELRRAIASHIGEDYAGEISPTQVCVTSGCNQAFAAAVMAIARAGDNVVIPVPYFFNHTMWLAMHGIEARFIPALGEGHGWPRPEDAAPLIDANTRAIILCSPNNPSGAIYPPEIIEQFFDLALSRGTTLMVDETYKDFRDRPAPPHNIFARADWPDAFIHLYSFSKAYAMTGYRIGSLIASEGLLADVEKILDCMSICAPHISQRAALFGLTSLADWKRDKVAMMHGRLSALREGFKRPGLAYEMVSSGALFAYVRHPFAGEPAKAVAQRLAGEHDVLCLPGSMFGAGQESFLRIAFANAEASDMEVLVDRLIESQG